MLLKDVGSLLGANERYFTVVYEAFKYKGEDLLRTYIDFIVREPVEWIRGFPLKLKTRASFAKPKAALIKLLKTSAVLEALGAEYCSNAHDVVWDTFKKHCDDILNGRIAVGGAAEPEENEFVPEEVHHTTPVTETVDGIEEVTDISGAGIAPKIVSPWERKYRILQSVVISMLHDYRDNSGLVMGVHALLANLDETGGSSS
jgi:hypothetical protein